MAGKIRTNELCPLCRAPFKETIIGNRVDLICTEHRTRPERYYVDGRHLGLGKVYSKRKKPFTSYEAARGFFDEVTRVHEEDPDAWDPSRYSPALRKPFLIGIESATWLSSLKQDTSAAYARNCESHFRIHIGPEFGTGDVRELNARMIEAFYRKLIEKKLAPKSIASILKTLAAFLKRERRLGVIRELPLFPKFKARPVKEKGWLHAGQQAAILANISDRHRLPFETMMWLGIRPGEVIALRTEDVLSEGYIRIARAIDEAGNIKETKPESIREMRVPADLHAKLMEKAGGDTPLRESAWLFTNLTGDHYSRESLHQIWIRARKKIGIKIGMYQGCRHSRATQTYMEAQEEAIEKVAAQLGNTVAIAKAAYIQSVRGKSSRGKDTP